MTYDEDEERPVQRAETIFLAAIERPESQRRQFVVERCGDDDELRREVSSLLRVHDESGAFDRLYNGFGELRADLLRKSVEAEELTEELGDRTRVEPGDELGRYRIVERLGEGGMGEVFRAVDPRLERDVAIKIIGRRVEGRPTVLERFEQEARAASALNHPNIVTVHDIGEQDGFPYIVMELVEGESLAADDGTTGQRSYQEILHLGRQICDGLLAAHQRGIVHRDLKPGNIMIDGHGRVRILDFGLARFRPPPPGVRSGAETLEMSEELTHGQAIVGTPGYLAPEGLRGREVDERTDQFAFGAILYELATGEPAFGGETAPESMRATLDEEPVPVTELRGDLPTDLVRIIERCLAKDPGQRFPETAELREAFEDLRHDSRGSARLGGPLPAPPGPLYGRREETRRLENLILDDAHRLVTLTGVGGAGKTRLALEVMHRLESTGAFPGGIGFVSLAPLDDVELLVPAVASVVRGVEAPPDVGLSPLIRRMNEIDDPMLLVLDNFEHLVEAAPTVSELLSGCRDLAVLVTSRELLRLSAEQDFPVRPLRLPEAGHLPAPARLREVPAVEMFVGRARNAAPDFELDEENAPAVVEICRRLDGLPLALELAAARVRVFPPRTLLRRLESRLDLLTGGPRDLPDRQRTLRAAIEWSYELLDDDEQAIFRRLGVFVGGFTLEAAEAVVDPFENLSTPVVDGIESLLDQSLLVPHGSPGEEPRFTMLETVREYAWAELVEHDEEQATHRAHAAFLLVLAEEAETLHAADSDTGWLERLARERGNFRTALDWLVSEDEGVWGMRLVQGLFPYWERGHDLSEGRRRFAEVLALPSTEQDSRARARALFSAGVLAANQRANEQGVALHEKTLEIYRRLEDVNGQAVALNAIGIQYADLERYGDARECYEECLDLWEELGATDGTARTLSNFAYVLRKEGDLERARRLYREAASLFEQLGDDVGAAWETAHEADVARDQGTDDAVDLYRRALEEFRRLEHPWGVGSTLVDLGAIATDTGAFDRAEENYRTALEIFSDVGHQRGMARCLEGLTVIAAERGNDRNALLLAGAVTDLRARVGTGSARRDETEAFVSALEAARESLGTERGHALREEGRALSLEEVLSRVSSEGDNG